MIATATSSTRCQRWRNGRQIWREAHPGHRFQPNLYRVGLLDEAAAKRFVLTHHYARSYPAAKHRYGLFQGGELVGVAVFSIPTQARVLTGVLPDLEPYVESVELGRFVLVDKVPGNGESWFLARAFGELRTIGVRGVVSFADPMRRTTATGEVITPGHIGTIYKAVNGRYTGRGTARTLTLLPDGTVLSDRAQQKVRGQDRGHRYVEKQLCALGASAPRAGQQPATWLAQALAEVGARKVRHHGAHRYVFPLGANRRERDRIRVASALQPYPTQRDEVPA